MKRVILYTICLTLIVCAAGCSPVIWYNPDKTFEQCLQDSLICELHDPFIVWLPFKAPGAPPCYSSCMSEKGYIALTKKQWKQLPTKTRMRQAIPYSEYYIAGQ